MKAFGLLVYPFSYPMHTNGKLTEPVTILKCWSVQAEGIHQISREVFSEDDYHFL